MPSASIFGRVLLDGAHDSMLSDASIEGALADAQRHRATLERMAALRDEMDALALTLDIELAAAVRDVTELAMSRVIHREGHTAEARLALSLLLLARATLSRAGKSSA